MTMGRGGTGYGGVTQGLSPFQVATLTPIVAHLISGRRG